MNRVRIFIGSVQREFVEERIKLREFVRGDPMIRQFFDVFLFEDLPAQDRRPHDVCLDEVAHSEIYVGLFGTDYGADDSEGVSPTEKEFQLASDRDAHRLIFVKGAADVVRHPKMQMLINLAQAGLIRRRFNTAEELVAGLYAA